MEQKTEHKIQSVAEGIALITGKADIAFWSTQDETDRTVFLEILSIAKQCAMIGIKKAEEIEEVMNQAATRIVEQHNKIQNLKQIVENACFRAFNHQIGVLPHDTISWQEWKKEWFDKNIKDI